MIIKLIFYSIGVVFAYFKHKYFFNIEEILILNEKIKEDAALAKLANSNSNETTPTVVVKRKLSDMPQEHKPLLRYLVLSFLFFIWMLIGLLSFNWIYFAFVLIFSLWVVNPLNKLFSNNMSARILLLKIHTILCWSLCIFVIINAYYLNIGSDYILNLITNFIR